MIGIFVFVIAVTLILAYLNDPKTKGRAGERAAVRKLGFDSAFRHAGKILSNVYIPRDDGTTSEIDILYITRKGLFVLENKNYAGYIFGSENSKNWTVTLYGGKNWYGGKKVKKFQFYNPVWQNRTHIRWLRKYLGTDIRAFSIISFTDRGELKDVTISSSDVYVCNHYLLVKQIDKIWDNSLDVLTDEEVEEIYERLLSLTNAPSEAKRKHVEGIKKRAGSTTTCPVCGGSLVLRTAKKGSNAGKSFYGCENFPKCRYVKNI